MAGDWIKMRKDLPGDPAVCVIAGYLNISHDEAIGKLFRFWCWVDSHVKDGNASSVTAAFLDRVVGETHFTEAMVKAGWLEPSDDGFTIPHFDRHMSQGAKTRALTAVRVSKHRDAAGNASVTPDALPEKRREEKRKKNPPTPQGGDGVSASPNEPDLFADFWTAYPRTNRKADRAGCREVWMREGLNQHAARVMAGLAAMKASPDWAKDSGRYIPAPKVFLNQRRWDIDGSPVTGVKPADPWLNGLMGGGQRETAIRIRDRARAEGVLDAFLRRVPRGSACGPSVAWAIDAAGSVKAWMETQQETK